MAHYSKPISVNPSLESREHCVSAKQNIRRMTTELAHSVGRWCQQVSHRALISLTSKNACHCFWSIRVDPPVLVINSPCYNRPQSELLVRGPNKQIHYEMAALGKQLMDDSVMVCNVTLDSEVTLQTAQNIRTHQTVFVGGSRTAVCHYQRHALATWSNNPVAPACFRTFQTRVVTGLIDPRATGRVVIGGGQEGE